MSLSAAQTAQQVLMHICYHYARELLLGFAWKHQWKPSIQLHSK